VLRTRLATAALAIPALWLIVRYVPAWFFSGFIVAVAAVGLLEYFTMALPERPLEQLAGIVWGIGVAGGVASGRPALWGAALAATVVGGLVIALVADGDLTGAVQRLGLTVLGVVYVGFFTAHAIVLHGRGSGWRWVLFTIFVAMGSDSGGYFAGRAWGRRKLAPRVSPAKTVEGAAGAVVGAVVVAGVCRLVFFTPLGTMETLVLAAVLSVLAQLGDLGESALKRAFGAKDSGWIIPGHGGILDRLDSLVFPVVFASYYAAIPRA
jgi:phosphatidate cytidylyltransferase